MTAPPAWYRRAAEKGCAEAQFELGRLYAEGKGIRQNLVQAYKWLRLAAALDTSWRDEADDARELLVQHMSGEELTRARNLAWDWLARQEAAKYADED